MLETEREVGPNTEPTLAELSAALISVASMYQDLPAGAFFTHSGHQGQQPRYATPSIHVAAAPEKEVDSRGDISIRLCAGQCSAWPGKGAQSRR